MILKDYPYYAPKNVEEIADQMLKIANIRKDDITQFTNLPNTFVGGRKVGKVPTSSADVNPNKDLVGDINYDASFLYILINNGGTAEWRRVAIGAF